MSQTKAEPSGGKGNHCACVTRVIPAAGDCAQERLRDTATAITVVTELPEYVGPGQTQPLPGCGRRTALVQVSSSHTLINNNHSDNFLITSVWH